MSHYRAYVFDAYGTLFDVHAAVRQHADAIGPQAETLTKLWRSKVLEYSWTRTLMDAYQDFAVLTEEALDYAVAATIDIPPGLKYALLEAQLVPDAFEDAGLCLAELKAAGFQTAILSNGTAAMLDAAVNKAGLTGVLDAVISVDKISRFKTHPEAYQLMSEALGILPQHISFQSSNRWDIAGAVRAGCRGVWVNRTGAPDEYFDLAPAYVVRGLAGLGRL